LAIKRAAAIPFAGYITDHQAEPSLAEIEEVEVIASDLPGLNAEPCVFKGLRLRTGPAETAGPALALRFPIPARNGVRIPSSGRVRGVAVQPHVSTHQTRQPKRISVTSSKRVNIPPQAGT